MVFVLMIQIGMNPHNEIFDIPKSTISQCVSVCSAICKPYCCVPANK